MRALTRRRFAAILAAAPFAAALPDRTLARQQSGNGVTVTMVTNTEGLGDKGFNDLAKLGLDEAQAQLGITPKVIESRDAASYIPNLTQAAEDSQLVIGVGALIADALTEIAIERPDTKFMLIDAVATEPATGQPLGNVASVTFREEQVGFLAGVAAALESKSGKVGAIGGMKIPPVERFVSGFAAGANSARPDAATTISWAGTFDDPALGKELALSLYGTGNDVVFTAAGKTGTGAFDAAKEKGAGNWVIPADGDQSMLGADQQLCVAAKRVDRAVSAMIQQLVLGGFAGGEITLGLDQGGVALLDPEKHLSEATLTAVKAYEGLILDGKIEIPTTEAALASFEPVALP